MIWEQPWAAPVVAVCGWSGSGKTTLLEAAIPRLRALGLAVAVVKHDAHGAEIDRPGKDSDRLFRAGATVVLRDPGQLFLRRHPGPETELTSVLERLALEHDLVLVEGHKSTPLPKVWLSSQDGGPPGETTDVLLTLGPGEKRLPTFLRLVEQALAEHRTQRSILGGLLLGGRSTRMGRPKQLLRYGGQTLAERVAAALAPHVEQVVLLGLGEVPAQLARCPRLPDPPGVAGPLAGIAAALRWAPTAAWVIAACDMPLLGAHAVSWLLGGRGPGRWAVLPRSAHGHCEPLAAVYEPQMRLVVERLLAEGPPAPRLLAGHPKVVMPTVPREHEAAFLNVNTAEAFDRLTRG